MRKFFTLFSFSFFLIIFRISPVAGQTYCTPDYSSLCSSQDFIQNFSFNSLVNNGTGCNGNTSNYIYYSGDPTTTVLQGTSYAISMQAGSAYAQGFGVWIDYNQDGDFDDAGEFAYASPSASTSVFTGIIVIPQTASLGATRLRVRCKYAASVLASESCGQFSFGETEDYAITIGAGNPNIHYTVSAGTICTGKHVVFTNTTTDVNAYEYIWDMGDGTTFTNTNPTTFTHTYSTAGIYNSYVTVKNAGGTILGGDAKSINVQQGTNGWFNMSKDSSCVNESVNFDANGNNGFVKWRMSDGYTSTDWYTSHSFPSLGTYTVNCIINTPCGLDTITRHFKVVNSITPDANFNFYPNPSACPNKSISFNPYTYSGTHSWNFGDGKTSGLASPYHTYTTTGTYSVTHTVANSCGNQASQTYTISIDNTTYPTNANFSYNPGSPLCPGIQVTFNSQNWEGQWSWNFGDGGTAVGQNPKHTYSTPGTYTVTHTITNECNNTLSSTQTIVIDGALPPNAAFSMNPNPACPNDLIYLYPNEQFGKTYNWKFGDGYTSSLKYPVHQFATAGTYSVIQTITNFCNLTEDDTIVLNVNGSLPINLTGSMGVWPTPACPTQPINISAGNWGFKEYAWNFGDGKLDTTTVPYISHSYSVAGSYTAAVTISNNCGSDSTLYYTINISNAVAFPFFTLNANPQVACPNQTVNINAPWGFTAYKWNMGDGSPAFTTTTEYVSHSYTATGSYPISVKVTDYCNRDTTYRDTVNVINANTFCLTGACSVNTWTSGNSCPNQSVSFGTDYGHAWYQWKFGDGAVSAGTTPQTSHTYTASGTYNYTLTITNYCGVDTSVYNNVIIDNTIQVPNWVNIYPSPDVACPGQAVQFNTDNSFSSYLWKFGDGYSANGTGSVSHTYSTAAVYNVSVTITNSCGNSSTLTVPMNIDPNASFPSWMSLNNSPTSPCPNSAVVLETTPGYASYNWHFGDGDSVITSTAKIMHVYHAAGSYNAWVKVTNSCSNSITLYKVISIDNNVAVSSVDLFIPNNPACTGDEVQLNASSGAGFSEPGLSYAWNFGDGSALDTTVGVGTAHSYTAAGTYNIKLTAINQCGNTKSTTKQVTINGTSAPYLNPWSFGVLTENGQLVNAVCPGDVLVFYFEGIYSDNLWTFGDGYTATAVDQFVRSNGTTVTTVKHAYVNAGSFNYSLKVGNTCGNHVTLSKPIDVNGNMLINGGFMIEAPTSSTGYTTCGQIDFVAFGGKNFTWDFGDGTTLTTISPSIGHSYVNSGNYSVKVTIKNGCLNSETYIKTITINGAGGASVSATPVAPTCFGAANGSISATVSGGQAPYTYTWYNSLDQLISTNVSASNLAAGSYNISVTDNNGCTGNATVALNNPAAITFTTSSTTSSCGGSTGTATASGISGGSSPYTYAWSNGQTTAVATGLSLGTYAITVRDANGCSSSVSTSVSESGAALSVTSTTSVSCNGASNGAANINVTGGTSPYVFAWSNGATTQNISGLTAGNYSVVVTDNNNCRATINATVAEPAAIVVNATSVISPTCGNFNGSAMANVSGGTSPYTYLWPNASNKTTQTVTGLPANTYSVNVTDAHGCTKVGTVTLSNSNAPSVAAAITNVSCNGAGNGAIDLTITGGTSPYLYTWNLNPPDQNYEDVSGLAPGSYFVSIQDAAGCLSFRVYNITQPAALSASVTSTSTTCGNNAGTANVTVSGGTTPYTYLWTGGQATQTATGLGLGSKTITVTDNKGCVTAATTTVTGIALPVDICAITVDSTSTKNEIVWTKPVVTNIDSFKIYRFINSTYTYIGHVAYSALSSFTDNTNGVNPNVQSYKYEIRVKDNCGNESVLSPAHQTIHLQVGVAAPPNSFNLSWNDYLGFTVTQYYVMIDSTNSGNWVKRDSVSFGSPLTWTDTHHYLDTVNYMIQVEHPTGCVVSIKNPEVNASNLNLSKSNINRIKDPSVTSVAILGDQADISIYPNPNDGNFSIVTGNATVVKLQILDMMGREVVPGSFTMSKGKYTLNIPEAKGIYILKAVTTSGVINKKFVIE